MCFCDIDHWNDRNGWFTVGNRFLPDHLWNLVGLSLEFHQPNASCILAAKPFLEMANQQQNPAAICPGYEATAPTVSYLNVSKPDVDYGKRWNLYLRQTETPSSCNHYYYWYQISKCLVPRYHSTHNDNDILKTLHTIWFWDNPWDFCQYPIY